MHRVRGSERRPGANTAINAATNAGAWRSDATTRNEPDPGDDYAVAKSSGPSLRATDKSCRAARNDSNTNTCGTFVDAVDGAVDDALAR